MTEQPRKKRSGVWAEIKTIPEPNTGLAVVITERVRGRPAYSYQIVQKDSHGGNKFIQHPVRGLDKVPVDGDVPATTGDVIRALVNAAETFIEAKMVEDEKKRASKPKGPRGDRKGKPEKKRKSPGGLSALAKADAEAKGVEYKSKAQRRKEKKQQAKASGG